jgi:hypothetical protein
MCWHLSIAISGDAVEQLHRALPAIAPACPELDAEVTALIANGRECFCLGLQCACGLFRKGASASERIRKRAKRDHWSNTKLQRALKDARDDWSGLHPDVRRALAAVAQEIDKVSIFLFWTGSGGRCDVREQQEVDADTFCRDSSLVAENRLLVVRKTVAA